MDGRLEDESCMQLFFKGDGRNCGEELTAATPVPLAFPAFAAFAAFAFLAVTPVPAAWDDSQPPYSMSIIEIQKT